MKPSLAQTLLPFYACALIKYKSQGSVLVFSIKDRKEQCRTIFLVGHMLKSMFDYIVESGFLNSYLPKYDGTWLLTLIEALECAILH